MLALASFGLALDLVWVAFWRALDLWFGLDLACKLNLVSLGWGYKNDWQGGPRAPSKIDLGVPGLGYLDDWQGGPRATCNIDFGISGLGYLACFGLWFDLSKL